MHTESAAKLAFLSRAESYPDRPESVEVIETHFAWVFLSRTFAYKLKKPLCTRGFDLTTATARRANCELEVALNRRLAEGVYVGVVPLVRSGSTLTLEGLGEADDWLVKMQRLPGERALDRAGAAGAVQDSDLERLSDKLAAFYARAARASWSGEQYREHLARTVERTARELASLGLGASSHRASLAEAQLSYVQRKAKLLDRRVAERRVVDAHGDLRPEHVFVCDPPQIIDCLEFSADLRLLDTAEEISFLRLECERLGLADVGARILELYRRRCRDDAPFDLLAFYTSVRASVRALLAALRVRDAQDAQDELRWRRRSRWYLDVAEAAIAGAMRSAAILATAASVALVDHTELR